MNAIGWKSALATSWPVVLILVGCSILSLAVMWERWHRFRRAAVNARAFFAGLKVHLGNPDYTSQGLARAISYCERAHHPLAHVLKAVLVTRGDQEIRRARLDQTIQEEVHELESYLPILGTIGSTAPYIGLLGTVIGIMRAFHAIAMNQGGGPGVVAGGISEALLTTALGLLVAIPAVVGYNFFTHRIRRLTRDMELIGEQLIQSLEGDGKRSS